MPGAGRPPRRHRCNMWPMFPFPAPRGVTRGLGGRGRHRQSLTRLHRRGALRRCRYTRTQTITITIRYDYKYGVCGSTIPLPLNPFTCSCSIKNIDILDTNIFGPPEIELITNRRTLSRTITFTENGIPIFQHMVIQGCTDASLTYYGALVSEGTGFFCCATFYKPGTVSSFFVVST